ncbi:CapA family protein, partial [Actinophytocola sp.]|uniref:CapA family protein n=1 Tax=Actinophytocola sp. TaxID=1872138 RepID=UPI002D7EDF97
MRGVWALFAVTAVLCGCSAPPPAGEPPATSVPASPVPATSTRAEPRSITVVAAGDVLIHPSLTEQARADGGGRPDFAPLLAGVRPVISAADLAICHLEVPLAAPGGVLSGYPRFSAPAEVAAGLAATGYDTCSTASNHTMDRGAAGVTSTLDALDAAGVRHTGSARSAREAATPLIMEVHGVTVAQVSYTFGFNTGTAVPP